MASEEIKKSYMVVETFEFEGKDQAIGDVVELTDEQAETMIGFVSIITEDESVLKKYKVIGEIIPMAHPGDESLPALEIGSIQEVPEELGNSWVENGLAELVEEDKISTEEGPELKAEASNVDDEDEDVEDDEFKNGIAAENHVG